jgi:hypothetical protein
MKVGWLVWRYEEDEYPILVPEDDRATDFCWKKVRIVYAEITE